MKLRDFLRKMIRLAAGMVVVTVRVGIHLPAALGFRNRLAIFIAYVLMGMLIFYLWADFAHSSWWVKSYFLWDKVKDILAIWVILSLCKKAPERMALVLLQVFLVIRFIWEIAATKSYSAASHPRVILLLFLIDLGIITYISLRPLVQRKRRKWQSPKR